MELLNAENFNVHGKFVTPSQRETMEGWNFTDNYQQNVYIHLDMQQSRSVINSFIPHFSHHDRTIMKQKLNRNNASVKLEPQTMACVSGTSVKPPSSNLNPPLMNQGQREKQISHDTKRVSSNAVN
jgi:hypothetical protein